MFRCLLEAHGFCHHKYQKKTRTSCTSTFVPGVLFFCIIVLPRCLFLKSEVHSEKRFCGHCTGRLWIHGFPAIQWRTAQFGKGSSSNMLSCNIFSGSERGLVLEAVEDARACHLIFRTSSLQARNRIRGTLLEGLLALLNWHWGEALHFLPLTENKQGEQACWMRCWYFYAVFRLCCRFPF